jgi:hypothetical protein
VKGPTGAPLEVVLQAFPALKNQNFRPFGSRNASETAQKRLSLRDFKAADIQSFQLGYIFTIRMWGNKLE